MVPNPLHPAVVHFPIVLMFLLPISAGVALWAIRRGANPLKAWAVPMAFAVALSLSAWVSLQTGQQQEEKVEDVVSEARIGDHEEAAETFLVLSGILVLVTAAGLAKGVTGRAARVVAAAGSLAVIGAGYQVGHSGGELVYTYGAASAYAKGGTAGEGGEAAPANGEKGEKGTKGEDDEKGEKGEKSEKGERGER